MKSKLPVKRPVRPKNNTARRCRFPKTSLKAANLIPIAQRVAIISDAIADDVELLLIHFRSKPKHEFHDFDDVWNELHFGLIHFTCVKREFRATFMNAFYACVLDYLQSNSPIIKAGAIFALYFLFASQPTVWGKNRIRVSSETWACLFDFYVESIKSGTHVEAGLIFDKLRKMGAFVFVQEEEIDSYPVQAKIEFERPIKMLQQLNDIRLNMIKEEPIDLCMQFNSEYDELAKQYGEAKQETYYTSQATLATQRNMKETLNVTEKRPRLLQNVLLTSTLGKDETDTMKRLRVTYEQMWNSKRKKLQQRQPEI